LLHCNMNGKLNSQFSGFGKLSCLLLSQPNRVSLFSLLLGGMV
jgi:hypothetical protein